MANRHGSSIKVLGQQVFVCSKVVLRAAVWFHHAMLCYAMLQQAVIISLYPTVENAFFMLFLSPRHQHCWGTPDKTSKTQKKPFRDKFSSRTAVVAEQRSRAHLVHELLVKHSG